MIPANEVAKLKNTLPFWLALSMLPLVAVGLYLGGWYVMLAPAYGWIVVSILDQIFGLQLKNNDLATTDDQLFWYRLVTLIWFPMELVVIFGGIWVVAHSGNFAAWETVGMMFGIGVTSGTVGIVFAHELMHQKSRLQRNLADGLMALTLYGHFRTEHLLVHHLWVGTSRDTVTALYNESFFRFFPRVLRRGYGSAWQAEKAMLARKNLTVWHPSNPFWKYGALQLFFLGLAYVLAGWLGVVLFAFQAFVAIWQLELTNYVEHYGLTRKHLGKGKYEHCKPQHSWNAAQLVSNLLLINLQRHSDHHYKPGRPYPLLQNYTETEAPQLSHGYPVMTALAMVPPLWCQVMNPKVRKWRAMYYPEITDWQPYKDGSNPRPVGAA